jgi:hypothetical protein
MVRKVVVLKPIYLFSIINEFINKTNKSHQIRSKKVRKLSLWVHLVFCIKIKIPFIKFD